MLQRRMPLLGPLRRVQLSQLLPLLRGTQGEGGRGVGGGWCMVYGEEYIILQLLNVYIYKVAQNIY